MEMINMTANCSRCGGSLDYKGRGRYECPFCGAEFFDAKRAEAEKDLKAREIAPEYAEEMESKDYDVADIVYNAAWEYFDTDSYGVGLMNDNGKEPKKADKAREFFKVPDDEPIYMVYDETFFGSCKEGYALTDVGFYAHYNNQGDLFIAWEDLPGTKIKQSDSCDLKVGKFTLTLTGNNSRDLTHDMLKDIRDQLS